MIDANGVELKVGDTVVVVSFEPFTVRKIEVEAPPPLGVNVQENVKATARFGR